MRLLLLLYCLCALACTRGEFGGVQAAGDTTHLAPGTIIGKMKGGTIIIQPGNGNTTAVTDNTKAGQRSGSAATAPAATSSPANTTGTSPWLYLALLVIGAVLGDILASKLPAKWLRWLPWRTALVAVGLLLAQPSQAQQQQHSPTDYAVLRVKASRYDSLLTEYKDLERFSIKQQHRIDTLKIDLGTSNTGNQQLRRALFNEIDYNQSYELNHLIFAKERARQQRRQRHRSAVLLRRYHRQQRYLRR